MGYSTESEGRKPLENETDLEKRDRDIAYVPLARYEKHREFFAMLNAKRYRLRAILGSAVDAPFDDLHSAISEVRVTAQMMMQYAGKERFEHDYDQMNAWRRRVFSNGGDDHISQRVDESIASIERVCQPILESAAAHVGLWRRCLGHIKSWMC
jgi:hypothetical protein